MELYIDDLIKDTTDFEFNNWDRENFFIDLPNKWDFSLAVLNGNSILGFSVNSRKPDIFYIHFFYIIKEFRRAGLGKALLKQCEKKALESNLYTVQLKCDMNNSDAMNFYLTNGYKAAISEGPKNDRLLLEKKLNK